MVANMTDVDTHLDLPPVQISGDLDNNSTPIDTASDVVVEGSVRDGAKLKSKGNVRVTGDIHNANIEAGGNLIVGGGISGEASMVRIGGELHTRYIISAHPHCRGDAHVQVEIVNTKFFCGGQLLMPTGAIAASTVHALQGLHCRAAGSDRGVVCELIVGIDPDLNSYLAATHTELEKIHKMVQHVRRGLQPLMDHMKQLSPEQKEKATELLFQADESEQRGKDLLEVVRSKHDWFTKLKAATVRVEEVLHHGVSVRFAGTTLQLEQDLVGPFALESEIKLSEERLFKIDASGHRAPIYSRAATDDARILFRKLLAMH